MEKAKVINGEILLQCLDDECEDFAPSYSDYCQVHGQARQAAYAEQGEDWNPVYSQEGQRYLQGVRQQELEDGELDIQSPVDNGY